MVDYLKKKMKTSDGKVRYFYVKTNGDGTSMRVTKETYDKFKGVSNGNGPTPPMYKKNDKMW